MDKLKTFYDRYVNWIVIILAVLLGLKSCQSCSRSRQIQYQQQQGVLVSDSLNHDLDVYDRKIDSLKHELKLQKEQSTQLKRENDLLRETNNYYKQSNKKLIDNINKEN